MKRFAYLIFAVLFFAALAHAQTTQPVTPAQARIPLPAWAIQIIVTVAGFWLKDLVDFKSAKAGNANAKFDWSDFAVVTAIAALTAFISVAGVSASS